MRIELETLIERVTEIELLIKKGQYIRAKERTQALRKELEK